MKKRSLIILIAALAVIAAIVACVLTMCRGGSGDFTIKLSSETLELDALEKAELIATVTDPSGGTVEKTVNWSSDNEAVVKVDGGQVTALTAGTATVTAEVEGKRAQCAVTVSAVVRPTMVLAKSEYEVGEGTTAQILPTIRFKSATLAEKEYGISYTFAGADPNIATVNEKGVIHGVSVGETEVTVRANFPMATAAGIDSELTAKVKIIVVPDCTLRIDIAEGYTADIYLQEATVGEVTYPSAVKLTVLEGQYQDKDITAEVTFHTSDETVAVVSEDGTVTLAAGAREGDTFDVWARYVTQNQGEVNSNRVTLTVRKAVLEKTVKGSLIIDLSAGGTVDTSAVFGAQTKIVDVYDSEDPYKTSLWDTANGRIDGKAVASLGERSLVIAGERISYQVNALIVSKVIRTAQEFADIFFSSTNIGAIKADGYYILGNNIDVSGIKYVGRGWNATDGYGLVGTFDGRGYTMDGFRLEHGGGIFGVISSKATLKNVAFTNVTMNSDGHAAILAYGGYGRVENVYVGISHLESRLDSANATIGLFSQCNAANVLKNIVVVSSTEIVHPEKTNKYGILESSTNKGAWENTFAVSADRLFGGDATAGDQATASAKSVYRFETAAALLAGEPYKTTKHLFPTSIWDLDTMTFRSSRQYFQKELDAIPESMELSVGKAERLVTNYGAYILSANNGNLKIEDGMLTASDTVSAGENARVTVGWGSVTKTIRVKTKQEKTVDVTYYMNEGEQGDLTVSGLPVNAPTVRIFVKGVDGKEISVAASCANGTLVIPENGIRGVQNTVASGEQTIRINYGGADDYFIHGVKLVWVINNADELLKMREHLTLNGSVYDGMLALGGDIDLKNVKISNTRMAGKEFAGVFDGRYHKLSNLSADAPNVGLLGDVSGTVKNLRVVRATVGTNTAAVIGGLLSGTAQDIYVQGTVNGDGMNPNSNLSNFGSGLLAGRIGKTARVDGCIVELTRISDGLRLATAFGKLHGGAEENVFTNCYGVNAAGTTFMKNADGAWVKTSFAAGGTNGNYDSMWTLWQDAKAKALALRLKIDAPSKPAVSVTMDGSYDMNAAGGGDLVVTDPKLTGTYRGSVAVKGTRITLENAVLENGKLTVPAASFRQSDMPSGTLTLVIEQGDHALEVTGEFVWILSGADDLLNMEKHMLWDGTTYTGSLALGADVDLEGVKLANFLWKTAKRFDGTFDGRMFTISNLNAANPVIGLFSDVGAEGVIRNLRLIHANTQTYTAPVVGGTFAGTIENVYVQGTLTGDGMNANSDLTNFGSGLLAGRILSGAKIRNTIVEVTHMGEGLRLATAFGKLHQSGATEETVFSGCYAVHADGCAFMGKIDGDWTKQSFATGSANRNFDSMWTLWQDAKAKELALRLRIDAPSKPAVSVTVDGSYDMNVTGGADLVVTDPKLTGTYRGSVTVKGTQITLENAVLENGKLTVPATSFRQSNMPSGTLTLALETDDNTLEITGDFVWVIHSTDEMLALKDHLTVTGTRPVGGSNYNIYDGHVALGQDITWGTATKFAAYETFCGIFDGRNHTVTGVTAGTPSRSLFADVSGTIRNLKLKNAVVKTYSAALVGGTLTGTVENVYVQGKIIDDGLSDRNLPNLGNFGCGLVAGKIASGGKVTNVIVNAAFENADQLYIGAAFGVLANGVEEADVFTSCYAVNAGNRACMLYQGNTGAKWEGKAFDETNGKGNRNFASGGALLDDAAARALAERLGIDCDDLGHSYVTGDWVWQGQYTGAGLNVSCSHCDHTAVLVAELTDETVEPTCTAEGQTVYTATVRVGGVTYTDTKTVVLEMIPHAYALAYDETNHFQKCSVCGEIDPASVTAHTMGDWSNVEGGHRRACDCGFTETSGHIYGDAWSHDATNHYHVCTVPGCDAISDSAAHTFGEWIEDTPATEDTEGTRHRICSVCQYREDGTIPQLEHTHRMTHVEAKEATCTAAGNIEYWYCDGCQGYFTDADGVNATTQAATVVAKLAHTYDHMVATETYLKSAGTETERAVYDKSCVCGEASETDVFYGSYAKHMDVNNGTDLVILHDVFTGSGSASVTIGTVTLDAAYADGKLTIPDAVLKAANALPTGEVEITVTYGEKSVTIPGIKLVWVVNNADELLHMRDHLTLKDGVYTGMIAVGADMDLSGKNLANFNWTATNSKFGGTFDGRLHTISNVDTAPACGLFRDVTAGGVIKNLKLTNVTVDTYAGGLVGGTFYGTIENVYAQGTITNDGLTANYNNFGCGLLVARSYAGAKFDRVIVKLDGVAEAAELGSAFGKLQTASEAIFTDCYVVGETAFAYAKAPSHVITRYDFSRVDGSEGFATMQDLWKHETAANVAYGLGLTPMLTYDMNTGADLVICGLPMDQESVTVSFTGVSGNLIEAAGSCVGGKLVVTDAAIRAAEAAAGDSVASGYRNVVVTCGAESYTVENAELIWVINNWNDLATTTEKRLTVSGGEYVGYIALGADIDMTGHNPANLLWKTVTTFGGIFDGRGHTLSNYTVSSNGQGLFNIVGEHGIVRSLKVTNATVKTYTAPVAYRVKGTLENIYVQGSITADGMGPANILGNFGCGLLAGQYYATAKVNNCIVEVTNMTANLRLATAFGQLRSGVPESIFTNCYAVNADGCAFMQNVGGVWTKKDFASGGSCGGFATMDALLADDKARKLVQQLGLIPEETP